MQDLEHAIARESWCRTPVEDVDGSCVPNAPHRSERCRIRNGKAFSFTTRTDLPVFHFFGHCDERNPLGRACVGVFGYAGFVGLEGGDRNTRTKQARHKHGRFFAAIFWCPGR